MIEPRRRAFLGAIGTAAGASLAGCWGSAVSSDESDEMIVLEEARNWLPAPAAIERSGYGVEAVDLRAAERSEALGESLRHQLLAPPEVPGIDGVEELSTRCSVGRHGLILLGNHDVAAIETAHLDAGYDRREQYRERPVLGREPSKETGVAAVSILGEDGVVHVRRPSDVVGPSAHDVATAIVDAADDEAPRFAEASEQFARLLARHPRGEVLTARAHPRGRTFRWGVAEGFSWSFGESTTAVRGTVLFDTPRVDELAVSEWADGAPVFHGEPVETIGDLPFVEISASVPTDAIAERPSAFPGPAYRPAIGPDAPGAEFTAKGLDTEDRSGLLSVGYDDGDSIAPDRIAVRGDGIQPVPGADQTGPGEWAGSTNGTGGTVTTGDSVAIGVGQEYAVRLELAQPGRSEPAILVRFEGNLDDGGPTVVVEGSSGS